jgi:O-glycosyl hydrolase
MTETSGLANSWPAPGAVADSGALGLALSIHRALTTGQESAWLHWQFADGSKAGPFTLTDATLLASSPKFVAVKHFARHIRPDAQRVNVTLTEAPLVKASAYVHAEDHSLTLVLINTDAAATTLTVQLPRARIATLDAFTSDASALWVPSTVAVQASDAATITVPAYGVVTLRGVGKPCQAFPRHHHRHQWERLIRILLGRFFGR